MPDLNGVIVGNRSLYGAVQVKSTNVSNDHNLSVNRDLPNQHPIEAITGLKDELMSRFDDALEDEGYLVLKRGEDELRIGPFASEELQPVQWTNAQVGLLNELLAQLKYDSSAGGEIAEQLIDSLMENAEWNKGQVNLFDLLLSHVKYIDDKGGEYADDLIASLRGESGKIVLFPDSPDDIGAVAEYQGVKNAGKFLVVGDDGNITTVAVPSASGVSF